MTTQNKLFAIQPTCRECGAELVKITSGLVCPEGHGRIVPLKEYLDRSLVPVDHQRCARVKQTAISTICREIERAERLRKKLEQRERESGNIDR